MAEKSQNWSIRGLRGSISWLKEKINAADDRKFFTGAIEDHWKKCLCDAIDTLDKCYNVATIDAHTQIHNGKTRAEPGTEKNHANPITPPLILLHLSIAPETIGGM